MVKSEINSDLANIKEDYYCQKGISLRLEEALIEKGIQFLMSREIHIWESWSQLPNRPLDPLDPLDSFDRSPSYSSQYGSIPFRLRLELIVV